MPTTRTRWCATTRTRRPLARGWPGTRRSCRRTAPSTTRPTAATSRAVRRRPRRARPDRRAHRNRAHSEPGSPLGAGRRQAGPDAEHQGEEHRAHGIRSLRHQPCRDEGDARLRARPGSGRGPTDGPTPAARHGGRETTDQQDRSVGPPSWASARTERGAGHRAGARRRRRRSRRPAGCLRSAGGDRPGRCTDAYSRRTEW